MDRNPPADAEDKVAACTAAICEEDEESYAVEGMGMGADLSSLSEEEQNEIKKVFPHPTEVVFIAQLKGGTTYVYRFSNSSATDYTTNVTVKTHQHDYTEEVTEKSTVSNKSTSSGGTYRRCKTWYCPLLDYTKVFSQVDECILSQDKFVWDGKEKKPSVTVTTIDGKKLNSKYYTVSYKNNKKVGKATVVLKFKGNYEGTLTKSFRIVPQGTKFTKTVTKKNAVNFHWKKQSKQTSGYEIQYARKDSFEGAKTVTVKGNKTTSKTIKKLKSGKKYYFRIRTYQSVDGKKYYSRWSSKKSARAK